MSLLLNLGTEPEVLCSSTNKTTLIGEYALSNLDMCYLIKYFLTNTDLSENDERIKLIDSIKESEIVPGYNLNDSRISLK